ncbi:MAG: molecular chaperone DnaK, partial [Chitinophagaceae bacterium]
YGDKLPDNKKSEIEAALNKLKDAHKSQDLAAIDAAMTELNQKWTSASEDLYKSAQGGQQTTGNASNGNAENSNQGGNNGGGEQVTDVPYEEVK